MSNRDAALALAERGWFPFPAKGKQPLVQWREYNMGDLDGEGRDPWEWATAIGVDCGRSGLAVIDIDDWDGYTQACDEHGDLPETLSSETPSGGSHLIFIGDVKSTVSKVGPKVDTRGRGGYIIVPPSDGYRWVNRRQPAELPAAWAEAADPPRPAATEAPRPERLYPANDKWGQRVLDGEIARVATAVTGTRQTTLFEAACNIFEAVKGGHLDEGVARAHLESVGGRIGLDPQEIRSGLESAWERTQARHPTEKLHTSTSPSQLREPSLRREDWRNSEDDDDVFEGLTLAQLRDMPPPKWVLEPLIPEGLTFLVGPPKVGKTFVALDWVATAAARGVNVLYFVGEGVAGFAQRVAAWSAEHPTANLDRLTVVPRAPQLLDPADVHRLHRTVARRQVDLLVIDTWSRATRGADENSHVDMSNAIGVLDDLREQHGLSNLIVHHTNAAGEKPRGHTSLTGAYEALWRVEEDSPLARTINVKAVAMKDHQPPAPVFSQIRENAAGATLHPSVFDRRL